MPVSVVDAGSSFPEYKRVTQLMTNSQLHFWDSLTCLCITTAVVKKHENFLLLTLHNTLFMDEQVSSNSSVAELNFGSAWARI
jgi:hypothetical protein